MAKKIIALIKLALPAGKATPAPPVGPALGQHGVNIATFCKEYNGKTSDKNGLIIPVEISVYEDRSYTFVLKTPPASVLILKAIKIKKGSGTPNTKKVGKITKAQVKEIAEIKIPDLNTNKIESAMLQICWRSALTVRPARSVRRAHFLPELQTAGTHDRLRHGIHRTRPSDRSGACGRTAR